MNTEKTEIIARPFDIVNGPSRDTLFDACKYACIENSNVSVDFAIAIGYTMPIGCPGCAYIPAHVADIKILGIEHDDESGTCFNLRGRCNADLRIARANTVYTTYKFEAFYNVKNRKGYICFSV